MSYWAHSLDGEPREKWQSLKAHLQAVSRLAGEFGEDFGVRRLAEAAGLCHDIGKYSDEFQRHLDDPRIRVDHSTAGAQVTVRKYRALGRLIAYAIAGHHRGLPDGGDIAREGSLESRLASRSLCDYSAYEKEISLPATIPPLNLSLQRERCGFAVSFLTRMVYSCLVDADFLDTERFYSPEKAELRTQTFPSLAELEQRLAKRLATLSRSAPPTLVNQKRAQVLENCMSASRRPPGLFTLTVPTGGGKTLSSLAFALRHACHHGLKRIFYIIPFTSIIEQNARVFREAVGPDVVLEHHSNAIHHPVTGDDEHDSSTLAEENWDMPLVVTTNVQFFESLFSNRSSLCRRLHNLARSVIILDEAQMLPVELLQPCVAALAELVRNYGSTVVLCSATQPALSGILPNDLSVTEITRDPVGLYKALKRVRVKSAGSMGDDEVVEEMLKHPQCLCIVNTRGHARKLYRLLGAEEGHYHLSAAMYPVHRLQRLSEIRARLADGEKVRVVSTQLIEAGVDVDFPKVMRSIAGIDSIAQAAGRCNREGKRASGEVIVFSPKDGHGMNHVWFRRTASIAAKILEDADDPLDLRSVERYFRDLYFYEQDSLDAHGILQKLEQLAAKLNFPFEEIASLFKVIGDETVGVVIPKEEKCAEILKAVESEGISRGRARALQPYTVSVRPWECQKLVSAYAVREMAGLRILADLSLYDHNFGLLVDDSEQRRGDAWII